MTLDEYKARMADALTRLDWRAPGDKESEAYRLLSEAAKDKQLNAEGHEDGLDVALEHLRKCACDALQTDDIVVEETPDEERVKQNDRDYEAQRDAFLRRNVMQLAGRRSAPAGACVLSGDELEKKIRAVSAAKAMPESWERRRRR